MSPPSFLWVIATTGRLYTLSTVGKRWKEIEPGGGPEIEFKRVSAHTSCAWGIGCDHQLYVFVHGTDVPIVRRVQTYENQRWNPMFGYCDQLLPTDRHQWSDEDGLLNSPKESFSLPSVYWVWEPTPGACTDGWVLDAICSGEQTIDKDGWQYAVDFPAQYTPGIKFTSCVRRRRWVKYRKFIATNRWAQILGLHSDSQKEPFIDVAVGGFNLPGRHPTGFIQVWTVTILGKVLYRHGVCTVCPEGDRWEVIPTQPGSEVINLSVGSMGLVWAVTWDGHCLVRLGIGKEKETGTYWDIVFPPDDSDHKFLQVSVGTNSVWAVTRTGQVFFRQGIQANMAPHRKDSAMGTNWVEMVGLMSTISCGPSDQIWGIGIDDRTVYYRTGVTCDEPCGKTWKSIILPIMPRITSSSEANPMTMLLGQGGAETSRRESLLSYSSDDDRRHDLTDAVSAKLNISGTEKAQSESRDSGLGVGGSGHNSPKQTKSILRGQSNPRIVLPTENPHDISFSIPDIRVDVLDGANSSASDSSDRSSVTKSEGRRARDQYDTVLPPEMDLEPEWLWVSGTGCLVDIEGPKSEIPNWFSGHSLTVSNFRRSSVISYYGDELEEDERVEDVWRPALWSEIETRFKREMERFAKDKLYESAIDRGVWTKKGNTSWWTDHRPFRWCEARIEVEQGAEQGIPVGSLILYYKDTINRRKETEIAPTVTSSHLCQMYQHMKFRLEDCICITRVSDTSGSNRPVLGLFTSKRLTNRRPLKLAFSTEQEFHDWLACLAGACGNLRQIPPSPSSCALWSTNLHGEVFTYEPSSQDASSTPSSKLSNVDCFGFSASSLAVDMYWRQIGGHLDRVETCSTGIVWGLGHDGKAYFYTGGTALGNYAGSATSNKSVHLMVDTRKVYTYENQRWNPLMGFSDIGLPTDRPMWSDISGREERRRENLQLPNSQWKWVSEWEVDFTVTEGCDPEGWQYAMDFPATYYDRQGILTYVRRRRWTRSCRLSAHGPWKEVGGDQLLRDISMQIDPTPSPQPVPSSPSPSHVPGIVLFAVSDQGNVLVRLGVTNCKPEGTSWRHVPTDQPFKCVSIGEDFRVWGISQDGAAWFRTKVLPSNPQGESWIHVGKPPGHNNLIHVSVGSTAVWIIDSRHQLWFRKEVSPSFPEGTSWLFVSFNVKHISCGFLNQTWIVSNSLETPTHGSVYRRQGITPDCPVGISWDMGIGQEWNYVTSRACIPGMAPLSKSAGSRGSILSTSGISLVPNSPDAHAHLSKDEDGGSPTFTSVTRRRIRRQASDDSLSDI